MTTRFLALIAAILPIAADPEPAAPPPKADVRGVMKALVTLVKAKALIGRLEVAGKKEKDTKLDRAIVKVPKNVKVFIWKGGKKVAAKFADLADGCKVQVVFVYTPYVQHPSGAMIGEAAEVLILESPKK